MANNYFQFKQFTIYQQHCAMKVCTDACIFGAYITRQLNDLPHAASHILDIGTGTGLLSLMVAQKTNVIIDAVEIEEAAFQQATDNFSQSPWKERLNIFNIDARHFHNGTKYDCIISNPPFFEGDLKSGKDNRNAAKHGTTLTLDQLLTIMDKNLSPEGFFTILLPYHRINLFIEKANTLIYFLTHQLLIKHTNDHPFFRGILFFSRKGTIPVINELVIKNQEGFYTPEFKDLLKDYYLKV